MTIKEAISRFIINRQANNYAPGTVKRYWVTFRFFLKFLATKNITETDNIQSITAEHIIDYQIYTQKYKNESTEKLIAPSTINGYIFGIKVFLHFLYIDEIIFKDLEQEIMYCKKHKLLPKNILNDEDIEKACSVINLDSFDGYRDRCMIELMYNTGMRRSEVMNTKTGDIDLRHETIIVEQGKGRKDRILPLTKALLKFLEIYITKIRRFLIHEGESPYLFLSVTGKKITGNVIYRVFKKYRILAGLKKPFHPHALRHAFAVGVTPF